MNIEPSAPTTKGPSERFAGDVWVDQIASPHESGQRMVVALVRFAPGARTAWHSHARGQYLRVTSGVGRFGTRDGRIVEVRAGQTIYTPPGEDHFHSASEDAFMEHIAMIENADNPSETTVWKEHVTAAECRRASS
ncbi:cupin domain-containing protein [Microbacterium aoyamense]|uniref:Cupin domain-containing protein n=1 Tax=Microbacterium aoyamense TaxID=344166 RepID=A0ABN2PCD9_9MICO|nr:cupin domain-containing protein [Microbacterium aoyamense]